MSPNQFLLLLLLAGLITGAIFYRTISRQWRSFIMRRRFKHGARGEVDAKKYLQKHGYKIIAEQKILSPRMWIDGKETSYSIKADYLVEKKGRRGLVEVKTGKKAVDPASSDTRRQVFEYYHQYDVDDFFLFDVDSGDIMEIRFETPVDKCKKNHFRIWLFGLITGIIAAGICMTMYR